MTSEMNMEMLLLTAIQKILTYFGVHESTLERRRSNTQRGEEIYINFRDKAGKPWMLAFLWEDANQSLSAGAYIEKVYDLVIQIIRDFIQQGAILKEQAGRETNAEIHLVMEA